MTADLRSAQIWILNPGDDRATVTFPSDHIAAELSSLHGVTTVRSFQDQFVNLSGRSAWLIARPPASSRHLVRSQLVEGSAGAATVRLAGGGWVAISQQLASERHAHLGSALVLPTPNGPARFRIAATISNLGWPGGAIIMSAADYARWWNAHDPTEIAVGLRSGTNPASARQAVEQVLRKSPGLEVITTPHREARVNASAQEGLGQLGQVAELLVIAAVLAMAAALGSHIWQQRPSLSALRLEGTKPYRLRRLMLAEVGLLLACGTIAGVVAGIYGQVVIDRYLTQTTGFPVIPLASGLRPLAVLAVVVLIVLAIVAMPAWLASRVSPALALEDE
ncbi:MAG: FtsX-like permease family protein [Solirubrobacteraceae bacterium]